MKMQIWKLNILDGVMDAIHGGFYAIYEVFVPDLKLTVNHHTYFVSKGERYSPHKRKTIPAGMPNPELMPDPELMFEVDLSPTQIADLKILANEGDPHERMIKMIAKNLKEHKLDATDYLLEDEDESK